MTNNMANTHNSNSAPPSQPPSTPHQPIPLRNLEPAADESGQRHGTGGGGGGGGGGYVGGQSASATLASFQQRLDARAQGQGARTRSMSPPQMAANLPGFSTYWEHPYPHSQDPQDDDGGVSPIDHMALQFALPPDIQQRPPPQSAVPQIMGISPEDNPYAPPHPYYEEQADTESLESDSVPLKQSAQPPGRLDPPQDDSQPRYSFQTVSDLDSGAPPPRNTQAFGYNLEPGFSSDRHRSYGDTLVPSGSRRSRSPSTSGALSRAGSIMRAMSQRVVMISGEGDYAEQKDRSRSPSADGRRSDRTSGPQLVDTSYPSQVYPSPIEKQGAAQYAYPEPDPAFMSQSRGRMANPLKGNSLGIFSPENLVRKRLCDILVNPITEPFILLLIILQTVLLAIESAPDVFINPRPKRWGSTRIDWAIFGIFVVFTLELIARVIVSGLVYNAPEYADPKSKRRVRERVAEQYRAIFQPERQKSVKSQRVDDFVPPAFVRSFTMMQGSALPSTAQDQQRVQLARRAFLRHGFNRLDFVAVISFWISFLLGATGVESFRHLYIFRMLSCLRIIRLLALTKGNLIILRSLKKAAPLLVRVSFLIGFFWLIFAIIGVQSFKSSLSRQCAWLDPTDPTNLSAIYSPQFSFCGGYINETTMQPMPWLQLADSGSEDLSLTIQGAESAKGYLCPVGSICLQQANPYNDTVHFDDILHSLELVFVIMSANTFTDLMYYTMNSDYMAAALFFGFGIMIMMLWMTNLLIAVITSSFQVIREESRASAFTADEDPLVPAQHVDDLLRRQSLLQQIYTKISWIWVVVIAFGLLTQATRSSSMPSRDAFINDVEIVVTIFLDIEIVYRIAADIRGFWKHIHNDVDLALAVITTIILIPPIRNSGQPYAWLTVFQILRVYRVVLAIPVTRKLIVLVLGNVSGIANLMLFVFLMTFLMAIFAAQLFRGQIPQMDNQGNYIRIPFSTIYNSFLGMYQILSTENWTDVLYHVTAYTTQYNTAWIGAIFLIGWFILAYFILVNMFIAVIQENFDVSEDVKRLEQVRAFLQRKELGNSSSNLALSTIFSFGKSKKKKDPFDYGPATMEMLLKETVVREFLDEAMDPLQDMQGSPHSPPQSGAKGAVQPGVLSALWGKVVAKLTSKDPNPFYSDVVRFNNGPGENLDPRQIAMLAVNATAARRKAQRDYLARHPNYNTAMFIFGSKNPIRRACQLLVGPGRGSERIEGVAPNRFAWYTFSTFIYAAIVTMVILACITTPLYQKQYIDNSNPDSLKWFVWTDLGFAIIFTVEAIIKIIADGFFWTPNAYFRSSWGIIDGIVLITLWINVITLFTNDGAVSRAVGAFKALRALRLLNISDSARETFHSLLIVAGYKILSAAFVSLSLLIPFAIYGVNLFSGQLMECSDTSGSIVNLIDCQGEYASSPFNNDWPVLAPRVAQNPYFNFDNFGSSLFILFQIVSQEGWVDVSFGVQAITGRYMQPVFGNAQGNALFLVVFNLLATVFVLTLFISVFMRNYTEQTGVAYLTAEQRSWLELRKLLRQISPSKSSYDDSKNKWKKWCHKRAIEKRGKWYTAITSVLVLHLILLLCEFYPEPSWWTRTRDVIFLVFTLIYISNIVIRIIGLGWSRFRKSSWDVYSLLAVTGAFATSVLFLSSMTTDTYAQLHKFFLVAIVFLLIPRNDALDQLFKTAAASFTTIGNLLATWLIFFLVFAIALTQTFSLTRFGSQETDNLNLRTVPKALILLFRMSCGEGWNQIMEDYATIEPPFCVESRDFFKSDCGSTAWAWGLFIAWNIISMYIFVNLFVSLIYESFSYVYQRTAGLAIVDRDEIRRFKEAWRSVDPEGTGFISKETFPRLLGELSGVFEMRIYDAEDSVRQIIEDVQGADVASLRHQSMASTSQAQLNARVNLRKLNQRLAKIDVEKVRERRRKFNIFFEEVMVSADPDKGISFTTVLMTLAHYNIISDSKSLRLEEFLRRRARLQRVEEEVRRRIVLGFFDMLYYSRQFKRHMEKKRSARMTAIPQLDVPEILVENEEEQANTTTATSSTAGNNNNNNNNDYNNDYNNNNSSASRSRNRSATTAASSAAFLSAEDARMHHRTWTGASADVTAFDTHIGHPLAAPRIPGMPLSPASTSPSTSPLAAQSSSAFSFQLQDPTDTAGGSAGAGAGAADGGSGSGSGSAQGSRRGSAVSPAQVREMLDDSVWMASIRRSATMRRSQSVWGSQGFGH